MSTPIYKFLLFNSCFLTGNVVAYVYYSRMKNQNLYKNTVVFHTAMEKLKSHPGAIHFLGEPIEDGYLTVLKELKEEETNSTRYEVRVDVKGSKTGGLMFFWLRRKEDGNAALFRIELYVDKLKRGLLIMNDNSVPSVSD